MPLLLVINPGLETTRTSSTLFPARSCDLKVLNISFDSTLIISLTRETPFTFLSNALTTSSSFNSSVDHVTMYQILPITYLLNILVVSLLEDCALKIKNPEIKEVVKHKVFFSYLGLRPVSKLGQKYLQMVREEQLIKIVIVEGYK